MSPCARKLQNNGDKKMSNIFPAQFADLEPVAGPWNIPMYTDRYRKRLDSTMQELQTFYDAVFPRTEEILAYCDTFDINDPPTEVRSLLNVLYSLAIVSYAIEVWGQPRVPDSGATFLESFVEPAI
jgi:hypothetical protein